MIKALIALFLEFVFLAALLVAVIILLLLYAIYSNFPEQTLLIFFSGTFLIGAIFYLKKNTKQKKEINNRTFAEGFRLEPVSEETIAAFEKLHPEEVKSFFRIIYGDGDDNIVKFFVKEALYTPDRYEYRDLLKSNIDAMEHQYSKYQKSAILTAYKLSQDPKKSAHLWYRAELLDHYADVCNYLGRDPIPEIEEDFQLYLQQRDEEEKLIRQKEEAAKSKARELKARKLTFLRERLASLEREEIPREAISEALIKSFNKEFGASLTSAYRIRGQWYVKIDLETHKL